MASSADDHLSLSAVAEQNIERVFNIKLRQQQRDALSSICCAEKDTIVSLPTGSGKSLCFEAITTALNSEDAIVLVVSPLAFLLKAEFEKLAHFELPAVYVGDTASYQISDLKSGKYRYILGNPEQLLSDTEIRKVLRTELYRNKVHTIVFDEVHTAVSWGLGTNSKPAFRAYFSQVGDLRALFPKAAMLCLTATASKTTIDKIKELFVLKEPRIISESPDRRNIRLSLYKVKSVSCFDWLLDMLMKPELCPRTIIYCRRFLDCTLLYNLFCAKFGKNSSILQDRLFDMVHSKTPQNVKDHISRELTSDASNLRVVIATKVLGMGLDIKCELVIQYGPPSTMDDYIQQIGRAGRSRDATQQSHSILFFNGKQMRNVDASMLAFLKSDSQCLRVLALSDYTCDEIHQFDYKHSCCSVCAITCECGSCEPFQNGYDQYCALLTHENEQETDQIALRVVSEEERQHVINDLYGLKDQLDRSIISSCRAVFAEPALSHGFSGQIIQSVLEELPNIFCVDDVIALCNISNYDTACSVVSVLSNVFFDMDSDFSLDEDAVLL